MGVDAGVPVADMPILPGGGGSLSHLGFGLWRYPTEAALLELALVVTGAYLYWRAARRVAGTDPNTTRRANLCGLSVLGAGVVTLAINLLGA